MARAVDPQIKFAQGIATTLEAVGSRLLSRMGKAGQAMGSVIEGFQSGGPWGAVIAAIGELIMGSTQFQKIMERVDVGFQMLQRPVWEDCCTARGSRVGAQRYYSVLRQAITPILKKVGQLAGWIFEVLWEITKGLGAAIIGVGHGILKFVRWLGEAWNNILSFVSNLFMSLKDVPVIGVVW